MIAASEHNQLIATWVKKGARVLDLGCGDGELLTLLARERQVDGIGVEIDENQVAECVVKGLQVVQSNIEHGLDIFGSNLYDYVVLSQTLQELNDPTKVLGDMLRIGKQAIVSITNGAHLANRLSFLGGNMPQIAGVATKGISRLMTVADFEQLCEQGRLRVNRRSYLTNGGTTVFALLARSAIYQIESATN